MKIAFIGGGNMGEAMLSAVLSKQLTTPDSVSVGELDESRRQYLQEKYGVAAVADNLIAIDQKDVVVLAIKPQTLSAAMLVLIGKLKPGQLVLSIIAGARITTLRSGLKYDCIVRSMPNTPAQIGLGMTVWTATREVDARKKEWASDILSAMGEQIFVDDEKYLDMATAISGSGPAYFFLFVESLVEAGVNIGLSREVSLKLVLQTMLGSEQLIQKSGKTPAELRRMVTSPGGTTAEAINRFEKGGLSQLVNEAVLAAYHKAKTLGN